MFSTGFVGLARHALAWPGLVWSGLVCSLVTHILMGYCQVAKKLTPFALYKCELLKKAFNVYYALWGSNKFAN